MAKQTTTKTAKPAEVPVNENTTPVKKVAKKVAAPAAATPAPVAVETATKPKAVKKVAKAAETPAPVVETAAPAADAEVAAEGASDSALDELFIEFNSLLQQFTSLGHNLKAKFRVLEKRCQREIKARQKQNSRRKKKSVSRAPSGFVKPTRISDELAQFLDKPTGSEMARTEVTREINKYIRTHNLQDKENGRKINPDSKLVSLLKLNEKDELTYFNLQRYMSPHFTKTVKEATVA